MATKYQRRKVCIDPADRTRTHMTSSEVFSVCANSGCDPRTLRKVWAGQLVQESSAIRLWAALKAAGLLRADAKKPALPVPLSPKESAPVGKKDLASVTGGA
jgi:hypothetical protein